MQIAKRTKRIKVYTFRKLSCGLIMWGATATVAECIYKSCVCVCVCAGVCVCARARKRNT